MQPKKLAGTTFSFWQAGFSTALKLFTKQFLGYLTDQPTSQNTKVNKKAKLKARNQTPLCHYCNQETTFFLIT